MCAYESDFCFQRISSIFFIFLNLTRVYFLDIMGDFVEPKDIYVAFTVDQVGDIVNVCEALGVEVIRCICYRVNSATVWSLGTSDTAARCNNKAKGELMKKLAACVGVFSHSAADNDKLKDIQSLEEDLHRVYELITRHEIVCNCT